jgi:hypothetical protein
MKQKRASQVADRGESGDAYTFVALDADTKLVPCFRVGRRTWPDSDAFIRDLRSRVNGRVQITTDAFAAYYPAIREAFSGRVDYGTSNQSIRVGIEHGTRALLASEPDRIRNGGTYRKSRRSEYLEKFCRAPESIGADGMPTIHAPDQRIQQEAREPQSIGCAALRTLQFCAPASYT